MNGSPERAAFVCEPQIESLWKQHQASLDRQERDRLIRAIQHVLVEDRTIVQQLSTDELWDGIGCA